MYYEDIKYFITEKGCCAYFKTSERIEALKKKFRLFSLIDVCLTEEDWL